MRLTNYLAKMLGVPRVEDGVELAPRQRTGLLVATKSAAAIVAEGKRMAGMGDPSVRTIADEAARQLAQTGDLATAIGGIFNAVRRKPLTVDPDTGPAGVPGR